MNQKFQMKIMSEDDVIAILEQNLRTSGDQFLIQTRRKELEPINQRFGFADLGVLIIILDGAVALVELSKLLAPLLTKSKQNRIVIQTPNKRAIFESEVQMTPKEIEQKLKLMIDLV
jgi:hypothetical protein